MRVIDGKYETFIKSTDRQEVLDYIDIMKTTIAEGMEIVLYEKTYLLISTVPHIIKI